MREDGSQLILRVCVVNEAIVDPNDASRHREGVDCRIIDDDQL